MLSKIKAFFTGGEEDRTTRKDIERQKELAQRLRNALSGAYNKKTIVKLTIDADGYMGSVLLDGDERVVEYLANFAAGQVHYRDAELSDFDAKSLGANSRGVDKYPGGGPFGLDG